MTASEGAARLYYGHEALAATKALWRYLETPVAGLWRDRMRQDGSFDEEPSPASTFYHLICAIQVMKESIHA
jgi:mannose-6-phosphate isomerase